MDVPDKQNISRVDIRVSEGDDQDVWDVDEASVDLEYIGRGGEPRFDGVGWCPEAASQLDVGIYLRTSTHFTTDLASISMNLVRQW